MAKNQNHLAIIAIVAITLLVGLVLFGSGNSPTGAVISEYSKCLDQAYVSEERPSPATFIGSKTRLRARTGIGEAYRASNTKALQDVYDCRRSVDPGGRYTRVIDSYDYQPRI